MEKRTNRIEILFTDTELERLKVRSKEFRSISSYIRAALVEFSDKDAKGRMQAVEEMASLCRRFKDELGWAGGNLNQAMNHIRTLRCSKQDNTRCTEERIIRTSDATITELSYTPVPYTHIISKRDLS